MNDGFVMADSYKSDAFGDGYRYKIQIEDAGTDPGGIWTYTSSADGDGHQAGFEGGGYYVYGTPGGELNRHQVQTDEVLTYRIEVGAGETGTYAMRFYVSRDGDAESDKENDLWLNFYEEGTGRSIESYLSDTGSHAEPTSDDFIKLFGGPNDGTWGEASRYDGAPSNPAVELEITKPGIYVIEIAGRSEGYHVDAFQLYSSSANPGRGASDSELSADTVPAAAPVAGPSTGPATPVDMADEDAPDSANLGEDDDDGGFFSFIGDIFGFIFSIFGGGDDDDKTTQNTPTEEMTLSALSDAVPVVSILDHDAPATYEGDDDPFDLLEA